MDQQPQAMFFRSTEVAAQWDTWMAFHEGSFYLYYLITEHSPGEGIGLAVSPDGVSWTDHGRIIRASDKMVKFLGTGAVWKAADFEQSGRFICNYSEWRQSEGDRVTNSILFAWSHDLIHWTKFGDEDMFAIDTRWYQRYGRWDCIFALARPAGGYYGYWTATPSDRLGIGFGHSRDGLHWEALPPPELIWDGAAVPKGIEAGAVAKIGDRYYAMMGHFPHIRTMTAERPEGPFRVAAKNYRLMENSGEHGHTYFSRFLPTPDTLLVNHHAITRFENDSGRSICSFSPLKEALVDEERTLWLAYWRGNDQLKQKQVSLRFPETGGDRVRLAAETLDAGGGVVLEGVLELPAAGTAEEAWPGLYVAVDDARGAGILVGAEGVSHFGPMKLAQGAFEVEDRMAREWPFGRAVHIRLLLKASVLEFYLDDIYIQSYSLPAAATGQIGVLGPPAAVHDIAAWTVAG